MINNKLHLIFLLLSGFWFVSCENELDFETGSASAIAFSNDTITFDTIFTTIGSSTRDLMLYNPHKKAINISSVKVASGGESGFRVNIDGMSGTNFQDVEIWGNDSAYVLVEVTVDPTKQNAPVLINDSLIFVTNGNTQIVHLIAYGQDVIIWRGKVIEQDTLLTSDKPFLIYDSLFVAQNATLTLDKGTKLYFHNEAEMLVQGTVKAKGTYEEPVLLRGDRLDEVYPGLLYDNTPGQWGGIRLFEESYNNEFEHVYIRSGSYGILADSSDVSIPKIYLKNSILHNVSGDLISGKNYKIKAINCQLSNAKGALVRLIGGDALFIHCTLANYFSFSTRSSPSLVLKNYVAHANDELILYPLIQATFENCIVYGNSSNDISLDNEYKDNPVAATFNHYFNHCLLGVKGEDDENFVQTIWNENPQFVYLNKDRDFVYNFQLDSLSIARNYGDLGIAYQYPDDLTGKSRINDEGPDLGCYEF